MYKRISMKLKCWINLVLSLPKTIYFNFHFFSFKTAMKLPVLVSYNFSIKERDGAIVLLSKPRFGMLTLGMFNGPFHLGNRKSQLYLFAGGKIIVKDYASVAAGSIISVRGTLNFGSNFICNANTLISCKKQIIFGDDVLIGWNCTFLDDDGHCLICDGKRINKEKAIDIGNHVWICAAVTILKGSSIKNDTVISSGSRISKKINESNVVLGDAGVILKRNITWDARENIDCD